MDDETKARLASLEARLAVLESRSAGTPMKTSRRCPACGGTKLLRTERLRSCITIEAPFSLSTVQPPIGQVQTRGHFELHVCTACGLVEWHALALDPSILDDPRLTKVESPPEQAPFR